MIAYNSPVALMNGAKQLGFVSETSLALHQVGKEIEQNMKRVQNALSTKERVKILKEFTNRAYNSSTQTMSNLYDKKAIKDFQDFLGKAILSKRPESIASQRNQLHYANAVDQIFKASQSKLRYGTTEKEFAKEFEEVINLARSIPDIKELEKALRFNKERNYNMIQIWDDYLKNFFQPIIKHMTQGGMTEGLMGRIGLTEPDIPFRDIANVGKKITQNLQVFKQNTRYYNETVKKGISPKDLKTVAIGMSKVFTKAQKDQLAAENENPYKDLYGVIHASEADMKKGFERLKELNKAGIVGDEKYKKLLLYFTKGLENDASLMSESMAQEFSHINDPRAFKDISVEEVNKRIKQRLRLNFGRKNKGKNKEEIDNLFEEVYKDFDFFKLTDEDIKNDKKWQGIKGIFREEMRKIYGVDDNVGSGSYNHGKGFKYDIKDGMLTNVHAYRKMDNRAFVGRNVGGDSRTNISVTPDEAMQIILDAMYGYSLESHGKNTIGKDADGNDITKEYISKKTGKMLVSQIKGAEIKYSQKSIQNEIISTIEFIRSQIDQNQVEAFLASSGLSEMAKVDKDGNIDVDNKKVEDYFSKIEKDSKGKKQTAHKLSDFLYNLVQAGVEAGVYKQNNLQFQEIDGERYLVETGPRITAEATAIVSNATYAGLGSKSNSISKFSWAELRSMENTYQQFSQFVLSNEKLAQNYDKIMTPYQEKMQNIRDKVAKNKKEYDKYLQNARLVSQNFKKDQERWQKDIAQDELAVILDIEEIKNLDAETDYNSTNPSQPGYQYKEGGFKNTLAGLAESKATVKYNELEKKYGKEWLAERGIDSTEDLLGRVTVNLGEERVRGKNKYDEELVTSAFYLPKIGFNKNAEKSGVITYDDGGLAAAKIVNSIKDLYISTGRDKDQIRKKIGQTIINQQEAYHESLAGGGLYNRTHVVQDDTSSGRLKTLGMSQNSKEVFQAFAEKRGLNAENLADINMILNTEDFKSMWFEKIFGNNNKEDTQKAIKMLNSLLGDLYTKEEQKKWNKKGKAGIQQKINALAEAFDITSDNFKGKTFNALNWHRDPTINFLNDVLGSNVVLSSEAGLVAQGNVLMNKHLLELGHGDYDGDLIAMYMAFQNGDEELFEEAYKGYLNSLVIAQKESAGLGEKKNLETMQKIEEQLNGKKIHRYGKEADINKAQDFKNKRETVGFLWDAKKGSGIYGDLTFAASSILDEIGAYKANINGDQNQTTLGMGARALHAINQSLYQQGINIKNAELSKSLGYGGRTLKGGELAAAKQQQADIMFDMINSSFTLDDRHRLRDFIERGETLGIFSQDAMFQDNTLTNFGLGNLDKNGLKNLLEIAESWKKKLKGEKDKKQYIDRIQKDIDDINDAINNNKKFNQSTSELVVALISALNSEQMGVFFDGKHLGGLSSNRYTEGLIVPKNHSDVPMFNKAIGNYVDETTQRFLQTIEKYGGNPEQVSKFLNNSFFGIHQSLTSRAAAFDPKVFGRAPTTLAKDSVLTKYPITDNRFNKFEKLLMEGKMPTDITSQEKGVVESMILGSLSHLSSELAVKYPKKYLEKLEKDKDYLGYKKALETLYGDELSEDGTKTKAEELLGFAIERGKTNLDYIKEYLSGKGNKIIGTEMNLAGFERDQNNPNKIHTTRQIADILYKKGNELIVGDYKNYASDELGLKTMIQVKDEVEALKLLQQAMRTQRANSWDTFLYSDNEVAKMWRRRLGLTDENDSLVNLSTKEKDKITSSFRDIYNSITQGGDDFTRIGGEAFIRDEKGFMTRYKFNTNDAILSEAYDLFKSGKNIDDIVKEYSEKAEAIRTAATKEDRSFIGTKEQQKKGFEEDFKKLYEALQKRIEKETQIEAIKDRIENLLNQASSEKNREMLVKLQEEQTAAENELTELQKAEEEVQKLVKKTSKRVGGETSYDFFIGNKDESGYSIMENEESRLKEEQEAALEKTKFGHKVTTLSTNAQDFEKIAIDYFTKYYDSINNLYNETERAIYTQEAEAKKLELDKLKKNFEEFTKTYKKDGKYVDENGEILSDIHQNYFNELEKIFTSEDYEREAKKKSDIGAVNASRKAYTAYYNYQKDKVGDQYTIDDLKERKAELESIGNKEKEIALLEEEIRLREELLDIKKKEEPNWALYSGLTDDLKGRVDRRLELENELKKQQDAERKQAKAKAQQEAQSKQSSNQGGGGFLGINNATSRWLQRMMNGGLIYTFIRMIRRGLRSITNEAKQLDQAMTNLRIVTGKNATDARDMMGNYAKLGKELGATTIEITQSATAWLNSLGHDKINSSNCWEVLKLIKLQHKNEIYLSVKVKNL